MSALVVSTLEDVIALERRLEQSATVARDAVAAVLGQSDPLGFLEALKFQDLGAVPLEPDVPRNVLQQVHQTFYYLVMIRGAEYLFERHADAAPFHLGPARPGAPDIVSADGSVAAETVALLSARNNAKLRSDIARLQEYAAPHRYLFIHTADGMLPEAEDLVVIPVELLRRR